MDIYQRRQERRKGPDILLRFLSYISVAGWALMFLALFFFDKAKPIKRDFFDYALKVQPARLRDQWNTQFMTYIFYCMIAGILISAVGLMINASRCRRRDDHYRIALVLLGIISAAGICIYLF